LKLEGFPVTLELIGAPMRGISRLKKSCQKFDPTSSYIKFHGELPHIQISAALDRSDIFIFASSCENLPIILLEAMASGIPIACSKMGPMPDILGDAGVYFNPLNVESISHAIRTLCTSQELRESLSIKAINRSSQYTWDACSKNTFQFLYEVTRYHKRKSRHG
jgi:glycosyltransferase involved in cell wall biosynthesis